MIPLFLALFVLSNSFLLLVVVLSTNNERVELTDRFSRGLLFEIRSAVLAQDEQIGQKEELEKRASLILASAS